jgi:hypothetical protein
MMSALLKRETTTAATPTAKIANSIRLALPGDAGESRLGSSRRPEIENHRSPMTKATTEPNSSRYVHYLHAQISKRDRPTPVMD